MAQLARKMLEKTGRDIIDRIVNAGEETTTTMKMPWVLSPYGLGAAFTHPQ